MNIDNINHLIEVLRQPKIEVRAEGITLDIHFDMSSLLSAQTPDVREPYKYGGHVVPDFCNTAACLAGTSAFLADQDGAFVKNFLAALRRDGVVGTWDQVAGEAYDLATAWLGLTEQEAEDLFNVQDENGDAHYNWTRVTHEQGILALEALRDGKGNAWPQILEL